MYSLEEALDSFNRKERNLLVRAALGQEGPLHLSERFRNQVKQALGLESIPEDASWATDYHISWLAGALALFVKGGEETAPDIWDNPKKKDDRWPNPKKPDGRRLVEGNQEDIDLVLATGRELILIEAKGYGAWDNEQAASKLARLELLHDFYGKPLCAESSGRAVNFHLLLISPNPPQKLHQIWPSWACKEQDVPPWIQLEIDKPNSVFEVTRCGEAGDPKVDGRFWRIKSVPRASSLKPSQHEGGVIPNYVGKLDYGCMIRQCEEEGRKIKVGLHGGIKKLRSKALGNLQQRSYKWYMTDTPKGPYNAKNWFSGDVFLSECRQIEAKERMHAPCAS
jgi:hypothetical protein